MCLAIDTADGTYQTSAMAKPTIIVKQDTTTQPQTCAAGECEKRILTCSRTITAGPPVFRPNRNNEGIPVRILMMLNDTLWTVVSMIRIRKMGYSVPKVLDWAAIRIRHATEIPHIPVTKTNLS